MSAPLLIVGRGRIGSLFADLAAAQGLAHRALSRADLPGPLGEPGAGPALVCTRNDDLDGLLPLVHPSRHAHLVFVQNGMLRPWLEARGLQGATQGLLYVAVPRVGAPPEPGGESLLWGPHAEVVAALLQRGGVAARATTDAAEYARASAYKFSWNAAFGLIGQATGLPVGAVAEREPEAVRALCAEMAPVLGAALGVDLDGAHMAEHGLAYARRIPAYKASLKEWRWRNGWLVEEARARGVALPEHAGWLARAGGAPRG